MRIRDMLAWVLLGNAVVAIAGAAHAAPVAPGAAGVSLAPRSAAAQPVDDRPYYHCHGPKRCHGKGNYYKYTPTESSEPHGCRYGRGCGYNNGWNSPSSRFDYIGRRYGRYGRHHRHRH